MIKISVIFAIGLAAVFATAIQKSEYDGECINCVAKGYYFCETSE